MVKETLSINVDSATKSMLQRISKDENRTLSNLCNTILLNGLKEYDKR